MFKYYSDELASLEEKFNKKRKELEQLVKIESLLNKLDIQASDISIYGTTIHIGSNGIFETVEAFKPYIGSFYVKGEKLSNGYTNSITSEKYNKDAFKEVCPMYVSLEVDRYAHKSPLIVNLEVELLGEPHTLKISPPKEQFISYVTVEERCPTHGCEPIYSNCRAHTNLDEINSAKKQVWATHAYRLNSYTFWYQDKDTELSEILSQI